MKRLAIIALLCVVLSTPLIGLAWAQGGQEGQAQAATTTQAPAPEAKAPQVDWGDYRYIFTGVAPSSDLDPQSMIINYFHPSLYDNNWERANYVHLAITIEWWNNDRPTDFMPLQLVLHNGGSSYILFGKANSKQSYLWRRGSHYANDLGARYPDHLNDNAKLFFTFNTHGARIDPNTAYVEVVGMLDVWNWNARSKLYVDKNLKQFTDDTKYSDWIRYGSTYFTFTPIMNVKLADILNPPVQ
jgi:hypothetical protein